jgi:hypothetical protein
MSVSRVRLVSIFTSLIMFFAFSAAQRFRATAQSPANRQTISSLELPVSFERHVGDLDGMVRRRQIRVLVIPSRIATVTIDSVQDATVAAVFGRPNTPG